jgi:pyruvate formate lyase activating enzyme
VLIQHLEKLTLLDFPGRVASVVFTYGCNLRCPYCHSPELVTLPMQEELLLSEDEIINFLRTREGKIDGLVITGGEPTVHKDLLPFIKKIKQLFPWLLIKLDSNGTFPERVLEILESNVVDYWAMDVKYESELYEQGLNGGMKFSDIKESINMIKNSGVEYEFRTTVVKGMHTKKVMESIGELIDGADIYYIQNFRAGKSIDMSMSNSNSFTEEELRVFEKQMKKYAKKVVVRGY